MDDVLPFIVNLLDNESKICLKYTSRRFLKTISKIKINKFSMIVPAGNGYINVIKWARENGCPWDEDACGYAAFFGRLEALKYLHKNGCPLNYGTCYNAAINDHLECLKYAVENGCPCDERVYCSAIIYDNHSVLKYLYDKGYCPQSNVRVAQ